MNFIKRKEEINEMALKAGFKSIHQLCVAIGLNEANFYTNLRGQYNISTTRMFMIANTLQCPVIKIIEIFYPDEVERNRKVTLNNVLESVR